MSQRIVMVANMEDADEVNDDFLRHGYSITEIVSNRNGILLVLEKRQLLEAEAEAMAAAEKGYYDEDLAEFQEQPPTLRYTPSNN